MRAIILAAGMGKRLRPITLDTPKSLITIKGETLIERQIKFLQEQSIDDIIVVTGYLSEKFDFLTSKYKVKLVYNDKYNIYNNFYSMYLVKEYLTNCYVIDADNYLVSNLFRQQELQSTYFCVYKTDFIDEWVVQQNGDKSVSCIDIKSGRGLILSGISYWDDTTGRLLQTLLENYYQSEKWDALYWDSIVKDNIGKFKICVKEISNTAIFEIDTINDLEQLKRFI